VHIADFGTVAPTAAAASGGRIRAGAPYLAMEYLPRGHVSERQAMPWPHVRELLRQVLEGLAHAHARGVLHLDIKPQNLLRGDGETYVLTDFGTAAFVDHIAADAGTTTEGTPMYMAPERVFGRSWDAGPWSDLYSVAAMAWVLTTGRAPFSESSIPELLQQHARAGIPALPDEPGAPRALSDWIRMAGHRDPEHRFGSAAAALMALLEVDDVPEATPSTVPWSSHAAPTPAPDDAFEPTVIAARVESTGEVRAVAGSDARPVVVPDFDTVLLDESVARTRPLGDGLLGRREAPFDGRVEERRELWEFFARCVRERRAGIALLEGNAGTGKSRLARWLAATAAERCGALPLVATHTELGAAGDGLETMVAVGLRAQARDAAELLLWARDQLVRLGSRNDWEAEAPADIVAPVVLGAVAAPPWRVRVTRDVERQLILERLVRRLSERRPVVLVVDDIQWGIAALGFVERLAKSTRPTTHGVAIVLTARAESRVDRPEAFAALDELIASQGTRIVVEPHQPDDLARILGAVLPLDVGTAQLLAERAAGNALFALQLAESLPGTHDIHIHVHRCALLGRAGRWADGLAALERANDPERRTVARGQIAYGIGYATVCMAQLRRTDLWDELAVPALADLQRWQLREPVLERCIADAGVAWLAAGDRSRGVAALERARWGLTGHHDDDARARVEAILADPESLDLDAPTFLRDMHSTLGACPAWLVEAATG
jgi:hypothetical protein